MGFLYQYKWLLFIFNKKCQITRCSFLFIQINLSNINIKLSTITYVIVLISCPVWRTAPSSLCSYCIPGSSVSGTAGGTSPFMGRVRTLISLELRLWGTQPEASREFYFSAGLRWTINAAQTACSHGPLGNRDHVCPRPRKWTTLHHYSLPGIQTVRPQREAGGSGATTTPSGSQGACQQREQSL